MKFAGALILILSSTGTGLFFSAEVKKKIMICKDLIRFCDIILVDFNYKITPAVELINSALNSEEIKHLGFISEDNVIRKKEVASVLSRSENEELSRFLYLLGKSDVKSQKQLVTGFKKYVVKMLEAYNEKFRKEAKIYGTFGFFFACILTLVWS